MAKKAAGRWAEMFADPRTPQVLSRLAAEALAEDDAGLTRDLDELLADESDPVPDAQRRRGYSDPDAPAAGR